MKNDYSILELIYLVYCVLRSRLISLNIRIIRFPISIRGRKYISFGKNFTTGVGCRLEVFSKNKEKKLQIGHDVQLNDYVHITAMDQVIIGNNVLVASKVYISDCSHGFYSGPMSSDPQLPPVKRDYSTAKVFIGDNVWIGEGVSVLPGSEIGIGAIIGAQALVKGRIPAYSIAVGIPAKVIKSYDFEMKMWKNVASEK